MGRIENNSVSFKKKILKNRSTSSITNIENVTNIKKTIVKNNDVDFKKYAIHAKNLTEKTIDKVSEKMTGPKIKIKMPEFSGTGNLCTGHIYCGDENIGSFGINKLRNCCGGIEIGKFSLHSKSSNTNLITAVKEVTKAIDKLVYEKDTRYNWKGAMVMATCTDEQDGFEEGLKQSGFESLHSGNNCNTKKRVKLFVKTYE